MEARLKINFTETYAFEGLCKYRKQRKWRRKRALILKRVFGAILVFAGILSILTGNAIIAGTLIILVATFIEFDFLFIFLGIITLIINSTILGGVLCILVGIFAIDFATFLFRNPFILVARVDLSCLVYQNILKSISGKTLISFNYYVNKLYDVVITDTGSSIKWEVVSLKTKDYLDYYQPIICHDGILLLNEQGSNDLFYWLPTTSFASQRDYQNAFEIIKKHTRKPALISPF